MADERYIAAVAPLSIDETEPGLTKLAVDLSGKADASHTHATSDVTGLDAALAAKAPLASPALTGTPTAPTATAGTNTTQVATTAFVATGLATKSAASHTHGVADLTATGTKDATTYLRGDNTWATPAGGGGGASALDDLTDVTLGTPAAGDVLTYDGTTWENAPPGGSGGPPSGAAGGVLSGTYPNPGFATPMATVAALNAVESASIAADSFLDGRVADLEAPLTVTTQSGTTYTYVLADADALVRHSNAGAITATVPPNSSVAFPIGTTIAIVQAGAGAVTLTPGVGVTLKVAATHTLVTGGTDALVHLVQTAANVWTVAGNLVEAGGGGLIGLAFQFGDGVTADAAGAVRIVPGVPLGLTPVGWSILPDASCSATFTVEKSAAGAPSWSSLVGAGTAPAITATTYAADTDGTLDWSGGSVAQFGAIKVTLATYTAGSSKSVSLTLRFARA